MQHELKRINNIMLLRDLAKLRQKVENKFPVLIIIDGMLSSGKTTLAAHVAEIWEGKEINFQEQIGHGGEDFLLKYEKAVEKGHKIMIYDEGGDFNRRGAMTSFNRTMQIFFDKFRAFMIPVIITLPLVSKLDKSIFTTGAVSLLLHCKRLSDKKAIYTAYDRDSIQYLLYSMEKDYNYNPFKAYGSNHGVYKGYFYNLETHRAKELDQITTADKKADLKKHNMKSKGFMTPPMLAVKLGISETTVKRYIREIGIEEDAYDNVGRYYGADKYAMLQKYVKTVVTKGTTVFRQATAKKKRDTALIMPESDEINKEE